MATLTSHTLDSLNGTHAGGVAVELARLEPDGGRTSLLRARTDAGGRLSAEVDLGDAPADARYELVFDTGEYFAGHPAGPLASRLVREAVVRFLMPDPAGRYHIPMMLAPNSYSVWWSQ